MAAVLGVVNAAAQVTTSPPPSTGVNFGSVGVGTLVTRALYIINNGSTEVTVNSYVFSANSPCDASIFGLIDSEFPRFVDPNGAQSASSIGVRPTLPNQTCTGSVTISYIAGSGGTQTIVVPLTVTDIDNSQMIPVLSATTGGPAITSINFGDVPLGTTATPQQLIVTNNGTAAFEVTAVDFYQPFNVTGFTDTIALNPGDSLPLTVTYSPYNLGPFNGFVSISYNYLNATTVDLTGTGTTPAGLAITNFPVLPVGTPGAAYQANFLATGGTPPYSWSITHGSGPQGLTLASSTGILSGTLSSSARGSQFTLTVTDSSSPTPLQVSNTFSLTVQPATGANCNAISFTTTGNPTPDVPLNDLGTGTYQGFEGGLYPNGSNTDDPTHQADGVSIAQTIVPLATDGTPDPTNGLIGMIAIGPSITEDPFNTFIFQAGGDPAKNPKVALVNGALGGETAQEMIIPNNAYLNSILQYLLPFAGVSQNQIEVAWVDAVDSLSTSFPADAQTLQADIESLAQTLYTTFPNLKIAYLGSLNYTGYSDGVVSTNPEPQGYETAFANKWAIQDQLNGTCLIAGQTGTNCLNYKAASGAVLAPWMAWGSYYWANGLLARQDGTFWGCQDMKPDGLHPTYPSGHNKINSLLLNFLKTDSTATPWFLASSGPAVTLQPTSLTFGSQAVGTTSAAQQITVTNTGLSDLTITSVTITGADSGDFGVPTQTCTSSSVAPNATCTINVTFTPAASGTRTASVSIADNASGSPQTVALTGTATTSGPGATLAPTSLTFAGEPPGTTSAAQPVTLTNNGTSSLTITSVSITGTNPGDYAQTNNCGTSVAAGASCTINVTFTPAASGTRTASVSVADNAPGSPQTVALSGTGGTTGAGARLSPSALTFSSQAVGSTSAAQLVTLTNTGGTALSIVSISTSGPFPQTSNCGTSLAAGSSCTINVSFAPTASGAATGALTVTDSAAPGTQTVTLSGTGAASAYASLSPTGLTFAATNVGSTSAAQTLTLTNTGDLALTLTSIAVTGANSADFTYTSLGCGSGTTLQVGASCSLMVTFKPTTTGSRSASITVTDNAPGSPQTVSLSGTGMTTPGASLSPANLTFASQEVGSTSAGQTVTLTNNGSGALTITSVSVSNSNFSQTTTCGASLAVGASCTITVSFKPGVTGNITGSVMVADNAPASPQAVTLTGTAVAAGDAFSPSGGLVFKGELLNTASAPQTLTLTNTGTAALSISSIGITGADASSFTQSNNCPGTLAAGSSSAPAGSCQITVTFKPTTGGSLSAYVTVTDNASDSPHSVEVSGAGSTFALTVPSSSTSVSAGQPASYPLTFAPTGGFSGSVTISCATTAPAASCSVVPVTLMLNSPNTSTATATVSTTASGASVPRQDLPSGPGPLLWWVLLGVAAFGLLLLSTPRQRTRWALGAALVLSLAWASCGGGGSSTTSSGPTSTPAGTYQVTVTAKAASVSQNITLTLKVQ